MVNTNPFVKQSNLCFGSFGFKTGLKSVLGRVNENEETQVDVTPEKLAKSVLRDVKTEREE